VPQGYIKMADFGFAKKIGNDRTFTICGTPDYQVRAISLKLQQQCICCDCSGLGRTCVICGTPR
jgi:hypothetical protein